MKYQKNVYKSFALLTQMGINMIVPIFLCSFVGMYIDRKCNTNFWMVFLFFAGALAGFRNIYILSRKIYQGKSDLRYERKKRRKK